MKPLAKSQDDACFAVCCPNRYRLGQHTGLYMWLLGRGSAGKRVDFDNGSQFINHGVVKWAGNLDIYSRPLAPLQEERPGHHRAPGNYLVRRCAYLLTAMTPARSARFWAACGSTSTSSSTPLDPHS